VNAFPGWIASPLRARNDKGHLAVCNDSHAPRNDNLTSYPRQSVSSAQSAVSGDSFSPSLDKIEKNEYL
jgi:hypothetical protein